MASNQAIHAFYQPWHVVRQWLIERKYAEICNKRIAGKTLNELKVVFLGDGGAGKSYTIARLLADGEQPEAFDGNATPGIVITDKHYRIGDRDVQIHFWDFGGQEILHSMHRMFLTDRTLYVVLLNVRDGTQDEVSYVLNVIRRFRLSFQVNETEEFIPMPCDRNSLDVAAEYENDRNTLEFRMEYDYLPNNVLHRLMVQLRGHLDTDNVWLTGARFEQQSTGLSAVVKSEGNDLRIFVRSTKKIYPANTYLSFIKDELDRINRDMGLTTPSNLVIYKADGIAEEFDYDDLLNALEDGEDTYRSRIRRKRIPIMDILNQTGHTADQDRDKLLQDIVSACMSMQSQKLYWHLPDTETRSKENVRNDNIREMLRAKGYIASDQSRSGRTRGGSQAGLLDIDIRRSPNVPWTIFEALNISKADKKDTDYWDDHLKKLLDYYNPMGLPYLFLVSYLECSREDFVRISSAYNEHMRWHDPQSYERASSSFEILPPKHGQFISTAKCTYDRGGVPTTVYHLCVRLGD